MPKHFGVQAQQFAFDAKILTDAINSAFGARETILSERNYIYHDNFKRNKDKQQQWSSFLATNKLKSVGKFEGVIDTIEAFLEPMLKHDGEYSHWNPEKYLWDKNDRAS